MKFAVALCLIAFALPAFAQDEGYSSEPAPSGPPPAPAVAQEDSGDVDPAAADPYREELAPYGNWVDVPDYGQAWQPTVEEDFVPYDTDGGWSYEDGAWNFASSYAWGPTCFHYGRWFNVPGLGWVWAPGRTWASSWVDWRNGNGSIGFAPRPPSRWSRAGHTVHYRYTPQKQFLASAGHFHAPPPGHGVLHGSAPAHATHTAPAHTAAPAPAPGHGVSTGSTPSPRH